MTMTVKLDAALERALRSRCAAVGRSASALMREALVAYLAQTEPPTPSAYALGHDLFGRHAGPQDLASQRKAELQQPRARHYATCCAMAGCRVTSELLQR